MGWPAKAPFKSTRCRRWAPCSNHCSAMAAGSSENTVTCSISPWRRRTQRPSFKSMAGMSNISEHPLGRRNHVLIAWISFKRHAHCTAKSLENGFALMVGIFTAQVIYMYCCLGVIDKTLEKLAHQLGIKGTDFFAYKVGMEIQTRTSGKIDDDPAQGLVQWHIGMAITTRSEEHTSELQSRGHVVCRLL